MTIVVTYRGKRSSSLWRDVAPMVRPKADLNYPSLTRTFDVYVR